MKKIMTTSNKLLLGLLLAVLLFITVVAGVAKYYGYRGTFQYEKGYYLEPPAVPETPTPPAPPAPPVPSE
ncbi:hypothetical protein [Botryobacter ruber]|uniref:hypothetical protein n=1 Tax=Botryobacter ruber TaxID=2171629 RepID=UPI000F6546CD|nr:hypothetical protein [Botryobacter ruber]